ncbi:MAG: hypothetical protein A2735_03225 [Candidatus Yanofskybacteria bacterium RIFCSPHIGHO2_01_FULL_41_21]|uniref:AI-2E family transporter n=1 Tax=Candidatus Yanofskybacteria bacterium RIFCSPHIGHO2_01_FULL_41_21 TaxID=1802660 RepID=A0A1F8EBI9_9BACT|nr:MAG: hypothetical protein A2735_03225 [Candidatus Yanofskybacteria bacterium RIFCSPHIGHO2_01_FULL_41_21]
MKHYKSELYFLLTLLLGVMVLSFLIFKPFLYVTLLAIFIATVFYPFYLRMLAWVRGNRGLASLFTIFIIVVILIIPLIFLATQILQEATQLYQYLLSDEGVVAFSTSMDKVIDIMGGVMPIPAGSSLDAHYYIKQGLDWLLPRLSTFLSDIALMVMNAFIFLIALYYLFKDGPKLKKTIVRLSPLQDVHDEEIFNKLTLATNSVIKGNLIIVLIQGAMAALGFFLFGVPSPVLWGAVAAVAAVIPGFGTALVVAPAIIYLLFNGETSSAIGLFIWGLTAVGLVDNILGPKLVERGMKIHPFLILLSILGGLALFGPLGFLFGPLVLSLFFALSEIYSAMHKEHQDKL